MIQKQAIAVNFSQGLDTKTDPWQVSVGKFLTLDNSIFTKGGLLQKRNGYSPLPSLPNTSSTYVTTLNGNLTALGTSVNAFGEGSEQWVSKGYIRPLELSTLPLIRNNLNQIQCDTALAPNGLVCLVYTENNAGTKSYLYAILDSVTGQNIVAPTAIPVASGTVTGSPRVFLLGSYFVIVFTNVITGTSHLQYVAIPTVSPSATPTANQDIASSYIPYPGLSWDGSVINGSLYLAYNTTAGGQSVKVTYLTQAAAASGQPPITPVTFAGAKASLMSLCSEIISGNLYIYVSYWDSSSTNGFTLAVFQDLTTAFNPVQIITGQPVANITSAAVAGLCNVFTEITNSYAYDTAIPTNYIYSAYIDHTGSFQGNFTIVTSVGLASKAFIWNGDAYFLSAYQSPYQPSYFLINGTKSRGAHPVVVAKLAYENGGGYLTLGLPNVTVTGNTASVAYLRKDLIQALSNANSAGTSMVGGIYSQTGVNLSYFDFTTQSIDSSEIASALQFGGGFLWMYDGYLPVEQNFFLWPDSVEVSTSTSGGSITAQQYFYQALYEWSDNQGNIHRSAGSIPVTVTTTGSTSTNTVHVPMLRLTYKTQNPVKIVIYRYSAGQPIWYQVTSITSPLINNPLADYVTFVDTQADSSIVGNSILYTTGGVIEDMNAPATNIMTLFDTRFWMVDAEDPNLLWFSKQVIENTPVEMSDLLTFYVAPTTAAQGSTGPITALAPMDDKLIIFKQNAIYYVNGTGPDNTGANNQYSQPIFITSTVGCSNQSSIVFMPQGLMFQSDKGIWLLGRGLETQYIGAPVEKYNAAVVQSAVNIPQTNQVRFTLDAGITLMYDYFYGQWGTFSGVPAISSCVYQGLHTFINSTGSVLQESPGVYLDNSSPVLLSFTTSWLNLGGLQGYQRAYFFYLLGQYLSPHKIQLGIAYNYESQVTQVSTIAPTNYSTAFGSGPSQSPFGQQTPMGGSTSVEQWRVFLARQRCQSFQITLNEYYDPSQNVPAGAGLTLSGLNLVVGISKDFRPISATHTVGGGTNHG